MTNPLDAISELTGVTFTRVERYSTPLGARRFILYFPDGGRFVMPMWQARSAANLTYLMNHFRTRQDPTAPLRDISTAEARTFTRLCHQAAELHTESSTYHV